MLAHFVVERLGVSLDRVLGRRVQGHEGGRHETQDRADIDDPAAALLAHVREHRARHAYRTEEIGLEQCASLRNRALLRSARNTDARIVDQDIDTAGSVEHLAHRSGDRLIVGDVERQEHHSAPRLPGGRPAARPVHGEPGADERARGRFTDPG